MKYLFACFIILFLINTIILINPVEATLINAKDTLSNPRLSDSTNSIQQSIHTITFTTAISVVDPTIEVRIPAKSQSVLSNDEVPDTGTISVAGQSGFDLGHVDNTDVTCQGGEITWQTPVVNASDMTGDFYHLIKCTAALGNTLSAGKTVIITIGNIHQLINPSATTDHITGKSDVYKIAINENDNNGKLVDRTIVNTAPTDGIQVSASVPEALSFTITGVTSGDYCGKTVTVQTTDTTVPFGKVLSGVFNASQLLTVSTNGSSGYTVAVQEDHPLSTSTTNQVTIPDSSCPDNKCSNAEGIIMPGDWMKTVDSGFGFSLSGNDVTFSYNDNGRKFNASPFSNTLANIMRHDGPIGEASANICYQLAISPYQQSGIYSNNLTFVATPKF